MFATLIGFADLLLASLVTGAMFGSWLILAPGGFDGPQYVALQQQGIRTLNVAMPVLGGLTIVITSVAAMMAYDDHTKLGLLIATTIGFLAAGLITRFLNQPINAIVIGWSAAAPPPDWMRLRDRWWCWHVTRLVCALCGLSAMILADLTT